MLVALVHDGERNELQVDHAEKTAKMPDTDEETSKVMVVEETLIVAESVNAHTTADKTINTDNSDCDGYIFTYSDKF